MEDVLSGFRILDEFVNAVSGPAVWMPVRTTPPSTPALGYRDLKTPRRLVEPTVAVDVVRSDEGLTGFVLLSDGARGVPLEKIGETCSALWGKPKAGALRLAKEASSHGTDEAVAALMVYTNVQADEQAVREAVPFPSPASSSGACPDEKRRKIATQIRGQESGNSARMRIAHILLKFDESKEHDSFARRAAPPGRKQSDAESELLEVLEALSTEEKHNLSARFCSEARHRSDCKSALNSRADLGWVEPGHWGKECDAAISDLKVGGLSDIVITQRGAHIFHRLA